MFQESILISNNINCFGPSRTVCCTRVYIFFNFFFLLKVLQQCDVYEDLKKIVQLLSLTGTIENTADHIKMYSS